MTYRNMNSASDKNPFQFPSQYSFIEVLGEGAFGQVVKCWKKDIQQTVAVKIPKFIDEETVNEVSMLRKFKHLNLAKKNIVKFIDCFQTKFGKAMVFEALDISIDTYAEKNNYTPMLLSDIRAITQQMATALDALKRIGVIHTDIKPDNIMMVNHQKRPFKVKLIDFGLAIPRSKAKPGMNIQPTVLRSPEIILGLPFSEAIDMWSLGHVMAFMICGCFLFPAQCDYETLQQIVEFLGQPAQHQLQGGQNTKYYFSQTETNGWRLKTSQEYFGGRRLHRFKKHHTFNCLDDMKDMHLEWNNAFEAVEREQSIQLLKAMLHMDGNERITPRQVLSHPFIVNNSCNHTSASASTKNSEASLKKTARPKAARLRRNRVAPTTAQPPEVTTIQPFHPSTPSPRILQIEVRPASAENTLQLEVLDTAVRSHQNKPEQDSSTPENTELQKTGKKKKRFQRFFSWMKKTFTSFQTSAEDKRRAK